ncbi:transmembrane protein [Legionella lansingensis]|uniref:Transmembrane protein n=1 Tax=Legionella lansingensis TaxID=45067 RepID=A0A0W0VYH2_9GAMM|nr:hypothetical protein [Legionella lansingensis]KTD24958.1 transmembrane protein [Legionella lansingensis]SNV48126.1 transmembrane protein [Legionella lansingensis]
MSDNKINEPGENTFIYKIITPQLTVKEYTVEINNTKNNQTSWLSYIYALYGALDGLSLSYSFLKYSFAMCPSSESMEDWVIEPVGMAVLLQNTTTLVVFSMLGNHFKSDDKNILKRYIAIIWPYCRDLIKDLKDGNRLVFGTLKLLETNFDKSNLSQLLVPCSLLISGLSIANHFWERSLLSQRKNIMKANANLLKEIEAASLSKEDIKLKREQIIRKSERLKASLLISSIYQSTIDSLGLYIGIVGAFSLTPALFNVMVAFCAIYFVVRLAAFIHEEYAFQNALLIDQNKIELALYNKEMELEHSSTPEEMNHHINEIALIIKKIALARLITPTYISAILSAAKNASFTIFVISRIAFLAASVLPATCLVALPIIYATLVSACLIGLITYAITQWQIQQTISHQETDKEVKGFLSKIQPYISLQVFQNSLFILDGFFSGLRKGPKNAALVVGAFRERHEDKDTSFLLMSVLFLSAITHGVVLSLRAYLKNQSCIEQKKPELVSPQERAKFYARSNYTFAFFSKTESQNTMVSAANQAHSPCPAGSS